MNLYEIHSDIVARVNKLERSLVRRDWIEAAAALFVVAFFGACLSMEMYPTPAKVGLIMIILGAIEATAVLFWARHVDRRPSVEIPFSDFCDATQTRVERQIRLLQNVNWWYSGPMMLGCCVFIYGLLASIGLPWLTFVGFLTAFCFCFVAVGYIIYRMNEDAVEKQLVPIRDDIQKLVRTLENGGETT